MPVSSAENITSIHQTGTRPVRAPRPRQKLNFWGRISRSPRGMRWLFNIFPPFFFARITMSELSKDFKKCITRIHPSFFNRNLVGTIFGGSLFAASDPQFMIMLMRIFEGSDLEIWDKSARIEYLRPATSTITLTFVITDEDLETIVSEVEKNGRHRPVFVAEGVDAKGRVCCRIHKELSIRKWQTQASVPLQPASISA